MREQSPLARFRRWLTFARLLAVPAAAWWVAGEDDFPRGHEAVAWVAVAVLAVAAVALLVAIRRPLDRTTLRRADLAALAVDFVVAYALIFVFAFEPAQPLRALAFIVIVEAALRFGFRGGVVAAAVATVGIAAAELWRARRFPFELEDEGIALRAALFFLIAAIVGRLTEDLVRETTRSRSRAAEAERLRDELGRRVDVLEAANRAARALASSLDLDQAFAAFIRELGALVPFDRVAIVLAEGGAARVMAAAGAGADAVFPRGTVRPAAGSVLDAVLAGELVYREDLEQQRYPEDQALLELGVRSELVAPLLLGAHPIGMLAVGRAQPSAFSADERELVSLLGRLVATAVQNIRAYEAERKTVEELRRLSTLRADFVSLVSHELRSPMASIVGSARTLQQRWRELTAEQRAAFLALIGDETNRLAALVGDVLDTSRIDAGTFSYSFGDVDVGELVRETVAAADLGQDEVHVRATLHDPLPHVRGDRDRLRQVLTNLIDNAVKYSAAGGAVDVTAAADGGEVHVEVADSGPGIPREEQSLIFEKFGRATAGGAGKPGTGLGLFIARSITEAHGGSLEVRSAPDRGATFTLSLPVGAATRDAAG